MRTHTMLLVGLFVVVPRVVAACPVCFGQVDAPLTRATNLGIAFMLGLVAVVLGGMAAFFRSLARRAALASPPPSSRSSAPPAADGVPGGAVRC